MKFLFILLLSLSHLSANEFSDESLEIATSLYEEGLKSSTVEARQRAFNQSLLTYLGLQKAYPDSPLISQAIGDNLFQLEEYAWAIFYYYRALKYSNQQDLYEAIEMAQKKLTLAPGVTFSKQDNFLSLNQELKINKRYFLFSIFLIVAFIFGSLKIWYSNQYTKVLEAFSFFLLASISLNLFLSYIIIPKEGIVVESSPLFQNQNLDPSEQLPFNVKVGSKVRVLDIQKDRNAIKIEDGIHISYIPLSSIAIL